MINGNRLERLLEIRDYQRETRRNGRIIVPGEQLEWETNSQGVQKWYMHPDMVENCLNSLLVYIQRIPPKGRTGTQRSQGGMVAYVWKGRGYSRIDGVRYDWEEDDVLNFPVRTEGIVVEHVNTDPAIVAEVVFVEPNTSDALGIDRGCGFEQLAAAPPPRSKAR